MKYNVGEVWIIEIDKITHDLVYIERDLGELDCLVMLDTDESEEVDYLLGMSYSICGDIKFVKRVKDAEI